MSNKIFGRYILCTLFPQQGSNPAKVSQLGMYNNVSVSIIQAKVVTASKSFIRSLGTWGGWCRRRGNFRYSKEF